MSQMKLVFIDFDGTLLQTKRSEVLFAMELFNRGMIGKFQLDAYFKFYLKWFKKFGFSVAKKNKAYLSGLERNTVAVLARRFVQKRLRRLVRTKVIDRIGAHRLSGHQIVLLTGTLDFIAKPLAEHLGISCIQASHCAMNDGFFSPFPPLNHPYGYEKLQIAHDLALRFKIGLSECIAYADSIADLPLLSAVSQPIVVAPDFRLARIAKQKGWEILK